MLVLYGPQPFQTWNTWHASPMVEFDQKLSSIKDSPNYTMAMHWLMVMV